MEAYCIPVPLMAVQREQSAIVSCMEKDIRSTEKYYAAQQKEWRVFCILMAFVLVAAVSGLTRSDNLPVHSFRETRGQSGGP